MNSINLTHPVHFKHWTDKDRAALKKAQTFKDLADIALALLERGDGKFHMVSGPISTGGVDNIDGNLAVFCGVVEYLADQGHPIFSQMPFEEKIVIFKTAWQEAHPQEKYCWPILNDFYEPILKSNRIAEFHFIHGYESSHGAMWEHGSCAWWGIGRNYLPRELSLALCPKESKSKEAV